MSFLKKKQKKRILLIYNDNFLDFNKFHCTELSLCTMHFYVVTVINNHSLGSILNFTLLDLVKQTKVTNTVYAIETKKISVCRYDLFM